MYLAFRFICRQSGTIQYGFKANRGTGYDWYTSQYHPYDASDSGDTPREIDQNDVLPSGAYVHIQRDTDYVIEEVDGVWDGAGDFWMYVDGEILLDFITFTNKPLDSFKTENSTMIEQDAYHIGLMAQRTVGNTQNIARLTITADMIEAFVGEYLDGELTLATLIQQTSSAITLAANNYADGKFAQLSLTVDGIEARVTNNEGDIAALELTAQGLATRISNAEGDIASLELTAQSLATRITNAEGDISTLEQTAQSLTTRITNAEGDVSTLQQTASSLTTRITNAEGDISTIEQTATSLTTRISNAEGDISTLEQTATSISSRITSEVNGLQSQITQTADTIELQLGYEDSNGNWVWASEITQEIADTIDGKVSTITIGADQVNINGNINLADTMDIENGEVAFYGDIYQGFDSGGRHYVTVEVSRGYGNHMFYGDPHIELTDYVYVDRWYQVWSYLRISSSEINIHRVYSASNDVTLNSSGLTVENSSSGASVTIEEDRIIISDGTNTKTITATS